MKIIILSGRGRNLLPKLFHICKAPTIGDFINKQTTILSVHIKSIYIDSVYIELLRLWITPTSTEKIAESISFSPSGGRSGIHPSGVGIQVDVTVIRSLSNSIRHGLCTCIGSRQVDPKPQNVKSPIFLTF